MIKSQSWTAIGRRAFLIVLPLSALLIVAGVLCYWGLGINRIGDNLIVLAAQPPVADRRSAGLLAISIPTILLLAGLWRLFVMFRPLNSPEQLGVQTVRHLRVFASFSAASAITAFFLSGVLRWAMGVFDDAPLWTHLGFSFLHATVLFFCAVIFMASRLIEAGYAYKRETEEYV